MLVSEEDIIMIVSGMGNRSDSFLLSVLSYDAWHEWLSFILGLSLGLFSRVLCYGVDPSMGSF